MPMFRSILTAPLGDDGFLLLLYYVSGWVDLIGGCWSTMVYSLCLPAEWCRFLTVVNNGRFTVSFCRCLHHSLVVLINGCWSISVESLCVPAECWANLIGCYCIIWSVELIDHYFTMSSVEMITGCWSIKVDSLSVPAKCWDGSLCFTAECHLLNRWLSSNI